MAKAEGMAQGAASGAILGARAGESAETLVITPRPTSLGLRPTVITRTYSGRLTNRSPLPRRSRFVQKASDRDTDCSAVVYAARRSTIRESAGVGGRKPVWALAIREVGAVRSSLCWARSGEERVVQDVSITPQVQWVQET
jgi:hypothetical protein